ncbi:MAG TPA: hypothetical protein VFN71_14515 [Methylomirabilota bacterium]|nr:hypothetical protein [Methylomirabilota bacterium]
MSTRSALRLTALALLSGALLSGCNSARQLVGLPAQSDPSVTIRPTESRWLLIKNPRFGDVASEPEYIWVEEDKVPTTMSTLLFGKSSILASPELVARYGQPPGGGRISPRQGGPYKVENVAPPGPSAPVAAVASGTRSDAAGGVLVPKPKQGWVVYVDTSRVVIDLTARDGVAPGQAVSIRRDRITIVHPVTGELLGELDEEVASGRVAEVREKFSVVEIQQVAAGGQVKIKDRVVVR